MKRVAIVLFGLIAVSLFTFQQPQKAAPVSPAVLIKADNRIQSLKILVLSTMLAEPGIGEWGFSALVEVDGHRILFDTGARPDTVLKNAGELGVDLAGVPEVDDQIREQRRANLTMLSEVPWRWPLAQIAVPVACIAAYLLWTGSGWQRAALHQLIPVTSKDWLVVLPYVLLVPLLLARDPVQKWLLRRAEARDNAVA